MKLRLATAKPTRYHRGKANAVALNNAGDAVFDRTLPNDEAKMRTVLGKRKPQGTVLLVADQPSIGATYRPTPGPSRDARRAANATVTAAMKFAGETDLGAHHLQRDHDARARLALDAIDHNN